MCAKDLEGVIAKRLADPYGSRVRWLKIKNPDYSQNCCPDRRPYRRDRL
jgi:ATP-dependent DNA ligase